MRLVYCSLHVAGCLLPDLARLVVRLLVRHQGLWGSSRLQTEGQWQRIVQARACALQGLRGQSREQLPCVSAVGC